jgi:hypothetical protein
MSYALAVKALFPLRLPVFSGAYRGAVIRVDKITSDTLVYLALPFFDMLLET